MSYSSAYNTADAAILMSSPDQLSDQNLKSCLSRRHSDRNDSARSAQALDPAVELASPQKETLVTLKSAVDHKPGQSLENLRDKSTGRQSAHDGMIDKFEKDLMQLQQRTQLVSTPVPTDSIVDIHGTNSTEAAYAREDDEYLYPIPKSPRQSTSPSRKATASSSSLKSKGSAFEIQGLEHGRSHLETPIEHPPRISSLKPSGAIGLQSPNKPDSGRGPEVYLLSNASAIRDAPSGEDLEETNSPRSFGQSAHHQKAGGNNPSSPNSSISLLKFPPQQPDSEPDQPFDFHRFLEQLRHRTADPVAKFLRSFLAEFGKKQWMVHEQVKIINDFLDFISNRMSQCEIWRGVSDAQFDNAKEGMEKLVMNRLYSQTFSPTIPSPPPIQHSKGKRVKADTEPGAGRRGQHQEDIERDEILGQKVRIYGWIQPEHLDIPPFGDSGRKFLVLAQQGTKGQS